jgi:DnaJ-class molecular chaperone
MKSCFGCKHVKEFRNHVRNDEQARCAIAEELFGGERWVNILEQPKCGYFMEETDEIRFADEKTEAKKVKAKCKQCGGIGQVMIRFMNNQEKMKCHKCGGTGYV